MKQLFTFGKVLAVLLMALVLVPQQTRADLLPQQDSVVVIKEVFHPGEIVTLKDWSDKLLVSMPWETSGSQSICFDPVKVGDNDYKMGPIYCIAPGTSHIRTSEVDLDKMIQYWYDIEITVGETNYVTVGFKGGKVDPSAVKDTIFSHLGQEENWVWLYYYNGGGGYASSQYGSTYAPAFSELKYYDVTVTSSNPDVIEVTGQYGNTLWIKDYGTATITVSCKESYVTETTDAGVYYIPIMAQSYSYEVTVKNNAYVYIVGMEDDNEIILDDYGWAYGAYCTTVMISLYDDHHYQEPSSAGLSFKVTSSDENVIKIDDGWNDNSFCVNPVGRGTAVITATFEGNDEFLPASTSYEVTVIAGKGPNPDVVLLDEAGEEVKEISMQEGETVKNPVLYRSNKKEKAFVRMTVWGSKRSRIGWVKDGNTIAEEITALAAGEEELWVSYSLYPDGPFDTIRVPVHISALNPSVTVLDLSMDPGTNGSIVFNANYNSQAHQVEINGALTDQQVESALASCALGTPGWVNALPNSMSFNLPAGTGSVSITGAVIAGYELRACIRGQKPVTMLKESMVGDTHTIEYESDAPVAIVFYVIPVSQSPSAPRRAKADESTPKAIITAISVTSNAPAGIDSVQPSVFSNQKVLIDGKLYIERNGVLYDVQGKMVK